MKNTFAALFIFIILLSSCGKDEDKNTTKEDLLTLRPWILTKSIYDPPLYLDGSYISNVFDVMYECKLDDLWEFNEGGTFVRNEGATTCQSLDPGGYYPDVFEMGLWAMSKDYNKLFEFNLMYYNYIEYDILNLTAKELQLGYSFYIDADTIFDSIQTVTDTYIHP